MRVNEDNQPSEPDVSLWPTETEAAGALQVSVKSIRRWARDRRIEMRKRKREGVKAENVCNPRDVEKLKPAAHVMPIATKGQSGHVSETALAPAFPQLAEAFLQLASAIAYQADSRREQREQELASVPLCEKLWLSLEEAVTYSGLARSFVLELARTDQVKALKAGPHRAWRILRESLEGYGR